MEAFVNKPKHEQAHCNLNTFMHPRNIYKQKKPDFLLLGKKHAEFLPFVKQTTAGTVTIDFKDSAALRALTCVLLKEDFGLNVTLPLDRLIPTVPQRLNYILWIEDLLGELTGQVKGIDVGTGASCIFPLLGSRLYSWKFLATEIDDVNLQYARENVAANNLQSHITVMSTAANAPLLLSILNPNNAFETYDFCMCNPPFYSSLNEALAIDTNRTESRLPPSNANTAAPVEQCTDGGEVDFVKRLIEESLQLKHKIRIYTVMLGKKQNLDTLKKLLASQMIHYGVGTFCQGRTMRFGLAWTFDPAVKFPAPSFESNKSKASKTLKLTLTDDMKLFSLPCSYKLSTVLDFVKSQLAQLQMTYETQLITAEQVTLRVTVYGEFWAHQRSKRRQLQRQLQRLKTEAEEKGVEQAGTMEVESAADDGPMLEANAQGSVDLLHSPILKRAAELFVDPLQQPTADQPNPKKLCPSPTSDHTSADLPSPTSSDSLSPTASQRFLFKFLLSVLHAQQHLHLEFTFLAADLGTKEQMHQVFLFFRNRLQGQVTAADLLCSAGKQ